MLDNYFLIVPAVPGKCGVQRENRKQKARSPLENESTLKKHRDSAQVEQSLLFFSQEPMELHTTFSERPTCKSPEVNSTVIKDGPVVTLTLGNTTNIQPTGKANTQSTDNSSIIEGSTLH